MTDREIIEDVNAHLAAQRWRNGYRKAEVYIESTRPKLNPQTFWDGIWECLLCAALGVLLAWILTGADMVPL